MAEAVNVYAVAEGVAANQPANPGIQVQPQNAVPVVRVQPQNALQANPVQPQNAPQPQNAQQPQNANQVIQVQVFQRRPMFNGVLSFADKLHKSIYDDGCLPVTKDNDVDEDGRHAFVTAFSFKSKRMSWGGDNTGILDIPAGSDA